MSDHTQCRHIKDDGTRCQSSVALSDDGLCFMHDPERSRRAQEVRQMGANASKAAALSRGPGVAADGDAPQPPTTLADALIWAAWAAHAVATGTLDTARGNAISRLLGEFRKTLEKSESREMLEQMRRQIADLAGEDGPPDLEAMP